MGQRAYKPQNNVNFDDVIAYISELIEKKSGNVLGETQKSMVASRLKKRLIDLGQIGPSEYMAYLEKNLEAETKHLISTLTTHHTFFFREFEHFEYMLSALPEIVDRVKKRGSQKIRIYSAACSRGQETYSLAMFFDKHLKSFPGVSFEIYGTDIDPECVKYAQNAVYPYNEVKNIPTLYLQGNWSRGKGDIAQFAKVKDHLKKYCTFGVLNLLKLPQELRNEKFDIIFCRNVFIYFGQETVQTISSQFQNYLYEGGLLITGLSESLKHLDLKIFTLSPSVYTFTEPQVEKAPEEEQTVSDGISTSTQSSPLGKSLALPEKIRILSVDDSSSILKLLKKIFDKDDKFELVGTATNGLEAQEFLKTNKVDAMTLDIHMPEMDGVEYLKQSFHKDHPKVVVVSSASRDDMRYAQKTLEYGASDFVEKPALNNLNERAEEIKMKIKMAILNDTLNSKSEIDQSFKTDYLIAHPDKKVRVFHSSMSDLEKASSILSELQGIQPPTYIVIQGNGNVHDFVKEKFESKNLKNISLFTPDHKPEANHIYITNFQEDHSKLSDLWEGKQVSLGVLGITSEAFNLWVQDLAPGQLLLEDLGDQTSNLKEQATDNFPWTSFAHLGTQYLSEDK